MCNYASCSHHHQFPPAIESPLYRQYFSLSSIEPANAYQSSASSNGEGSPHSSQSIRSPYRTRRDRSHVRFRRRGRLRRRARPHTRSLDGERRLTLYSYLSCSLNECIHADERSAVFVARVAVPSSLYLCLLVLLIHIHIHAPCVL